MGTLVEADETFFVDLFGATAGATISDANATGLIRNDDFTTTTPIANLDVLIEASAIAYYLAPG